MATSATTVFETERLRARTAVVDDADLFLALWTDPRVMTFVGFPHGLPITRDQIVDQLAAQHGRVFDARLVVELRTSGEPIGECKLGTPNVEGIAETDVKLLPRYWGNRYGVEVKRALVDYLFTHTTCTAVQATPNIHNVASIRMQEAVGGVRVGEGVFTFPADRLAHTCPVPHYVYRVYRPDAPQ